MIVHTLLLVGSYLVGALPFGLLVAHFWAGIDVREHGSRNTGATNVYRVVGQRAGIVVFTFDVAKGLVPTLVAARLGYSVWWQIAAGLAAFVGHSASIFLGFQGGKGVSTALGVLFAISWKVGVAGWLLWSIAVGATGYVSVGSILAAILLTPFSLLFYPSDWPRLTFAIVSGALCVVKHIPNIKRLMNGTENSFRRPPKGDVDTSVDDVDGLDGEETADQSEDG